MTALTGCFGEGERGEDLQPRHPHWRPLARRLLDAGADPNDGQALYNLMFQTGRRTSGASLRIRPRDTATGDRGDARLGEAVDSPSAMVSTQLRWAITHGMRDRVRLLVENGVELEAAYADGRTPIEVAALTGYPTLVAELEAAGRDQPGAGSRWTS